MEIDVAKGAKLSLIVCDMIDDHFESELIQSWEHEIYIVFESMSNVYLRWLSLFCCVWVALGVSPQCSALCSYTYNSGGYNPGCSTATACTVCDDRFFVLSGTTCIPHNLYGETMLGPFIVSDCVNAISIPICSATSAPAPAGNMLAFTVAGHEGTVKFASLPPHYAVRFRFQIIISALPITTYYSFVYGPDINDPSSYIIYSQPQSIWTSDADIVTTDKWSHQNLTALISFRLAAINMGAGGCCPGGCCAGYIAIRDVILFASICSTNCLACNSSTICVNCNAPSSLYDLDSTCHATCPETTFKSSRVYISAGLGINQNYCAACNQYCQVCNVTATTCYKCFPKGLNESFWFYDYVCYVTCPGRYVAEFDNHTCTCPLDNNFEIISPPSYTCNACSTQCLRCFGSTNLQCTVCSIGYFLAFATTNCLNECPDGQYQNNYNNVCSLCDASCSDCLLTSTQCTSCQFTNKVVYLLDTACVSKCPAGYSMNNSTRTCIICDPLTYSYLGVCLADCPSNLVANQLNHSCLGISLTNLHYGVTIESVKILGDGKTLKFSLLFKDGISNASLKYIVQNNYHQFSIVMNDSQISFTPITSNKRLLASMNLAIKNINFSNNEIFLYCDIPMNLDYYKTFTIVFNSWEAKSANNISYLSTSNTYAVANDSTLLKQYYMYYVKNYCNLLILPILLGLLIFMCLRLKGTYEMLIEYLRMIQLIGLLVYSSYPVATNSLFFFVLGFNYANFDFLPNLYLMFAATQPSSNFQSFLLISSDMDFLRFMGAVIFFSVLWVIVLVINKYLIKAQKKTMDWMMRLGMDLIEVKVLHSFWSSMLHVIINATSTSFTIYLTHAVSYFFIALVIWRRWTIWKSQRTISIYFIWRVAVTLLVTFISFGNLIILMVIFLLSIVASISVLFLQEAKQNYFEITVFTNMIWMENDMIDLGEKYEKEMKYSGCTTLRTIFLTLTGGVTAICMALVVLLKTYDTTPLIVVGSIIILLLIFLIVIAAMISAFITERRKYLMHSKIDVLKMSYDKLAKLETEENQLSYSKIKNPVKPAYVDEEEDNGAVFNQFKVVEESAIRQRGYQNPLMKVVE